MKTHFRLDMASQNSSMQRVRQIILERAEINKQNKIKEIERAKKSYYELLERANSMECGTYYNPNWGTGIRVHDIYCTKCRLKREAQNMSVNIYEWPLPSDLNYQNAIMFELLIPESVCYLRDSLHTLQTKIFRFEKENENNLSGTWIRSDELPEHCQSLQRSRQITLGSYTASFAKTHYRSKHPTCPQSDFLPPNGYTVSFCDSHSVI